MRKFPILIMLLSLALLVSTTQAFAGSSPDGGVSTETPTPTATVTVAPTATGVPNLATQLANFNATRRAGKPRGNREHFKGTVGEVTDTSLILTLSDGSSLTIGLDPRTRMFSAIRKNGRPARLHLGDVILVQAIRTSSDNLMALFIMMMPSKPTRVHRIGTVTDYVPGVSITIQDRTGATVTYNITNATKIMPSDRASQLAKGVLVTIVAQGDSPAAIGIVITTSIP